MVSTPEQYRQGHDPYIGMEEAEIRPSFSSSRQKLSDAEKNAVSGHPNSLRGSSTNHESSTDTIRRRERNQRSDAAASTAQSSFRNFVKGKNASSKSSQKRKQKSPFKKIAPTILIIFFGVSALFLGLQSFLGPHISALYTQATDLQFTSYNLRNPRIMSYMLDGGGQIKITNFTKKYTLFSPYIQKRLAKNGIEVGHLNSGGDFEAGQAIIGNKTVLKYDGKIIDANSFQNEFISNANFREAYYNAKRGRIAGFFDKSSEIFYKNKGATRNIFDQYKSTGDEETDMKNFKDTVSNRVTGIDGTINTVRSDKNEETGEETAQKNGEDIDIKNIDGDTPETKARAMVNNIAGKVSAAGVPVCSALRIANIAAIAAFSYQIYQSTAYFLSFMEPISKMMAGEGDASAINETLNTFTQQTTNDIEYVDEDGKVTTKAITGSMLESSGARLIMGNTVSPKSAVQPFSFNNISKAAAYVAIGLGSISTANKIDYTTICSGVQASAAIISLASLAVPGGKLAKFVIGGIAQTIGGVILTGTVAAVVSAIIPYIAKLFIGNVFEAYTGIPAGELFSQGAAAANFSLATHGSAYMPASEDAIKTQNKNTTIALALEAEVDRLHRSPFDISSPNTFLGSIMAKLSYTSFSNPLTTGISNFANIAGNSMRSLIPFAAADDGVSTDIKYTTQYSECSNLKGTVCDMYDYTIPSSDYSTIDIKPDDPTYMSTIEPNLDKDGNIKDNSELAKFINFCVNRESPWGVSDANILNALQTDGGILVNNLIIVNDFIDIINAIEDLENKKWATGEYCMNSSSNPRWDSEFKYYQRYIEDMRIIYSMADPESAEENPVISYQQHYYESHPIDTSFKGTLSRISGLSTDDVAFLLEYIDYSNQIANYNPNTRAKFGKINNKEVKLSFTHPATPSFNILLATTSSIFVDRRNYIA